MTEPTKAVFLSYGSEDADAAEHICAASTPKPTKPLNGRSRYAGWALGELLLLEHKPPEALEEFRKVSFEPFALTGIAMAEHSLGHSKESQQARDTLIGKYSAGGALQIAEVHAWLGDNDRAFEWLQRAFVQRDPGLGTIKAEPLFNSLHGDSRYHALVHQMNLPE